MRLPRTALPLLALILAGPVLLTAQDEPLPAGSEGVPVPKKRKHVQPVYPPEALAQGIRGIVILNLVIDTEGRVVETTIIRSIPGLDEAALSAVQQWVYEPVEVNGRPVSVRLTVPITFALKLPELTRDTGIPDLRQGVTPPWPAGATGGGQAAADVTLEPDGRVGLARIIEGEEPWSTSLLQALRTWRFRLPPEDVTVSFRVEAEFLPDGPENGDVELHLTGLREAALLDAPAGEALTRAETEPAAPRLQPAEEPPVPDTETPEGPPEGSPVPRQELDASGTETAAPGMESAAEPEAETGLEAEAEAQPETEARSGAEPQPGAGPGDEAPEPPTAPARPPAALPEMEPPTPPVTTPEPATGTATAEASPPEIPGVPDEPSAAPSDADATPTPGGPPSGPSSDAQPTALAPGANDPTAPPPVEVLTAAPPPLPPENGISAIRGVEMEPGVPDLIRGRRPVSPPFARMAGASGVVTVEFSVSAGGITAVQRADGPEVFQAAATQAVESWVFRRTRADRAYLTAVFTYEDDLASAVVRPQAAP